MPTKVVGVTGMAVNQFGFSAVQRLNFEESFSSDQAGSNFIDIGLDYDSSEE